MKEKKGFTLIEMLGTILILSLVILIATPKINSYINTRKKDGFIINARNISRQIEYDNLEQNKVLSKLLIDLEIENLDSKNLDLENSQVYLKNNEIYIDLTGKGIYEGMYICGANFSKKEINVQEVPCTENVSDLIKLNVELNGGSITQTLKKEYKPGEILEIEEPIKDKSTFVKWEVVKGNSTINGNILTIGTRDTIIYAIYESWNSLDIDLDGGSISEDQKGNYASGTVIELVEPTKENYKFIGWKKIEGDAEISANTLTMGNTDVKIKAMWELNIFNLSVELNGGSITQNPEGEYNVGTIIDLEEPTKQGHTFIGWTVSGIGASLSGENLTIGNSDVTISANWQLLNPITAYSCANSSAGSNYVFTYTGDCTVVDEGDGNWKIKFLTSGDLAMVNGFMIDIFLVGGGGGGSTGSSGFGGGGGGGYTRTVTNHKLESDLITVTIGDGGGINTDGQPSSFGSNISVDGGKASYKSVSGGSGGSGGGAASQSAGKDGGYDGKNGTKYSSSVIGGTGQGVTTKEFGEETGTLYAGGGGGGCYSGTTGKGGSGGGGNGNNYQKDAKNGTKNTGGGGGGGYKSGSEYGQAGSGGSGIVIIRNARNPEDYVPLFDYTGTFVVENEGDGNWQIKFLSSGTLTTFTREEIDIFLVGGGGGGSTGPSGFGGGGGGGYTKTVTNYNLESGSTSIVIGEGGIINSDGFSSSFGSDITVDGGKASNKSLAGGNGGSGGGAASQSAGKDGGYDGSNGIDDSLSGGIGQGTTTRAFGEETGTLYAGGGGGGCYSGTTGKGGSGGGGNGNNYQKNAANGTVNTGGGGGGGYKSGSSYGQAGSGGSGIVIIRNVR